METNEKRSICSYCENTIQEDDDFCPSCGILFSNGINCVNHLNKSAAGVCIICLNPLCTHCGLFVNGIRFLCDEHSNYEIYQNMVRVFGSSDALEVEYYKDCLDKEGFHPIIYSRKTSPISLGSPDYTLFRASGEFNGHLINEYKLMVPCQEVITAEELIEQIRDVQ